MGTRFGWGTKTLHKRWSSVLLGKLSRIRIRSQTLYFETSAHFGTIWRFLKKSGLFGICKRSVWTRAEHSLFTIWTDCSKTTTDFVILSRKADERSEKTEWESTQEKVFLEIGSLSSWKYRQNGGEREIQQEIRECDRFWSDFFMKESSVRVVVSL